MAIHQQFDFVANGLPRRHQPRDPFIRVALDSTAVHPPPMHLVKRRALDGAKAGIDRSARRIGKPLCAAVAGAAIEVGVQSHGVAPLAAQQAPSRHPERLAGQIPQRLVDCAPRRGPDAASVARENRRSSRHLFPQHLYLGRVRTHQPRTQLLQRGRDQAVVAALARFAQPAQPGVGVNLHEDPSASVRRRYRV